MTWRTFVIELLILVLELCALCYSLELDWICY